MNAFDADVLVYAAVPGHPLGRRVCALFPAPPVRHTGRRARCRVATAVGAGADRFITNNHKHIRKVIAEIDVTYPDDLPGAV